MPAHDSVDSDDTASETSHKRWMNRTVAGAGITSALGDFCYETTTVILPGSLAVLGIPADTFGAVHGPLLGVALLGLVQGWHWSDPSGPFRFVQWLSVIPGALAIVTFLVLVQGPQHSTNPALKFFGSLLGLPARFKRYLGAVGLFGGGGDFSHVLLIPAATTMFTPSLGVVQAAQVAGLLYVWRNVVQVVASWPVGWLADRFGHHS